MLGIRTQPSLSRDFTLLSLFIILILLVVSAWVTVETLENHADSVIKELETESLRLDRAMNVEIENASYILESLGRQIQTTGPANHDAIAQLFSSFAKTEGPKRSNFSWIDGGQSLIISSNLGVLAKPIDVSDRDYVKKSIAEPWKVHIGRPIMGRLSEKIILPLSLGITDVHGTYIGTVVVALDVLVFTDEVSHAIKDSGVQFAITNMGLTLVTQTPQAEKFFTANFDINALAKVDFTSVSGDTYSRPGIFDHDKIFSYYERSSKYPFIIFVGTDFKHTASAITGILLPRLFQLVVIALFLLFVLWTVRLRIIHPVMQLTHNASAIARGEKYNTAQTVGPLEIEQLAYEIKRLYDYIEERKRVESELRQKNAELARVKEAATLTNKVKADFFAYVGQELTEPTEIIREEVDSIKERLFGPLDPKYVEAARTIHEQALQLLEMLNDIKAISEAETGLLALNESELDLNFTIQKTVRIFRDKQPFDVQFDPTDNLPRIRGDDLRLKQMILSILNAIARHVAAGDVIRIVGSMKAQELYLHFAYSQDKKTQSVTHASRSKHGLELAMARLLAGMHQATFEMKTTQDRTTTITVKFPASRVV